jgi:hypothetical protein
MTKWLVAEPAPLSAGARDIERIEYTIPERPLLHVCCANDHFGDVNVDIRPEVHPDYVCDITQRLPFKDDEFGAVVGDLPWTAAWKTKVARAVKECLRVAPVAYFLCPWTYGAAWLKTPTFMVAWTPGVNQALLWTRYERKPKSTQPPGSPSAT